MILILSDERDSSTNRVIDWIWQKKEPFSILRDSSLKLCKAEIGENGVNLYLNDTNVNEFKSYWYRRGAIRTHSMLSPVLEKENREIEKIRQSSHLDIERLQNYFDLRLKSGDVNALGSFLNNKVNKMENLCIAKEVGLNIPKTLITNSKKDLLDYFGDREFIVKPIGEARVYNDEESEVYTYTSLVDKESLEEQFHVSLFQEKIEKKYEIRVFVLGDTCYSMAILSQRNESTAVDFRNYDNKTPNRNVPYQLPTEIENGVLNFMKKADLKSGSVDLMVTPDNKYVFLEVNPVGQFGMVSRPCNYNLEKKIADYLANPKAKKI